jgi:hypothetical protein
VARGGGLSSDLPRSAPGERGRPVLLALGGACSSSPSRVGNGWMTFVAALAALVRTAALRGDTLGRDRPVRGRGLPVAALAGRGARAMRRRRSRWRGGRRPPALPSDHTARHSSDVGLMHVNTILSCRNQFDVRTAFLDRTSSFLSAYLVAVTPPRRLRYTTRRRKHLIPSAQPGRPPHGQHRLSPNLLIRQGDRIPAPRAARSSTTTTLYRTTPGLAPCLPARSDEEQP